ncbi:MAG: ABC transporter permease [Bacillota bacterium]
MLRRIGNMIARDLRYASKENILIYVIVFPIVITVLLSLFLPSLEDMELTFALDPAVPREVAEGLRTYGRVQYHDGLARLSERVLEFDDVPGIYVSEGKYRVLLEGNEASYVRELPGAILDQLLYGRELVEVKMQSLGVGSSLTREFVVILTVLGSVITGGLVIALSIVEDRESRSLQALAVSPLNTLEYLLAKSALGSLIAVFLSLASALVLMGTAINYVRLTAATLSSLGIGLLFGLLIGHVAHNQLTAIAAIKILILPFTGVPVALLFIPQSIERMFYPLPMYWSFESLYRVVVATDLPIVTTNLLSICLSLAMISLLVPGLRRAFRL